MPDRLAHPAGSSDTPAVVAALHFFLALCLCLQMLAMSPPTAEELPQVEAEIGLLRQAVLLCDQLLAAHGSDQGGGSTGAAVTAAATAEPASARAQSREQGQSGPSSLSAPQPLQQHEHIQQAQGAEVHAAAHEQQQEQEAGPTAACSPLRDHKRQAAALQQAGMAHPEEGSPRMAGRHPLRGYWLVHRAASWFGQGSCVHQQKITRVSVFYRLLHYRHLQVCCRAQAAQGLLRPQPGGGQRSMQRGRCHGGLCRHSDASVYAAAATISLQCDGPACAADPCGDGWQWQQR